MASKKIILIEDDDLIRDLYKMELSSYDFVVDAFGKGKDGLAAVQKGGYDILLLDIMLPDMGGLEILKQIRQNPATKDLPVLLLTNLGQDTVIKEGFRLGANGYLIKVVNNPDKVAEEIRKILASESSPKLPLKT